MNESLHNKSAHSTNGQQSLVKRIRFTIRLLGLTVVAAAIPLAVLGWVLSRTAEQRAVVTMVRGMGGLVAFQFCGDGTSLFRENFVKDSIVIIDLSGTPFSDLSSLQRCGNVSELYLNGTSVQDLEPLRQLKNLVCLDLKNTPVSDISVVSSLSVLCELDVSGTQVSDLGPISRLNYLRTLKIANCRVTDLQVLGGLQIRDLDISGATASLLSTLPTLSTLERVTLTGKIQ